MLVRGIGSISGGIKVSDLIFGGVVVQYLEKLLNLVHYPSRSIFGVAFGGENFQLFLRWDLWSDNWRNYLIGCLNIIPLHISWELNLQFLLDFPWIFCADFSEFLWWGVSVLLTWAKMTCFTCCRCLFPEISCFCYLFDIMKLCRISTFLVLGWPHVRGYATGLRNL